MSQLDKNGITEVVKPRAQWTTTKIGMHQANKKE